MALPPGAKAFTQPLDPTDIDVFELTIGQSGADDLLAPGEAVAAFGLAVTAEAAAAGLRIMTEDGRAPSLVGLLLRFWLTVDTSQFGAAAFSGAGIDLGLELTVKTTSTPYRTKQKTLIVKVAQQ